MSQNTLGALLGAAVWITYIAALLAAEWINGAPL